MTVTPSLSRQFISSILFCVVLAPLLFTATVRAQAPSFNLSLSPATVGVGSCSELTFEVQNNSAVVVNDLAFSLNLPDGVYLSNPANATSDCGGIFLVSNGGNTITLSGGSLGANATCSAKVGITLLAEGPFDLTTGDLTSDAGNSGSATASIGIPLTGPSLGFSKSFTANPVQLGGQTTLTYTIQNQSGEDAQGISFSDNLSPGIVVAPQANISNNCVGSTLTAIAGSQQIDFSGATLPAGQTCVISFDVVGLSTGANVSVSGEIISRFPGGNPISSGRACGVLEVIPPEDLANISFSKSFLEDSIDPGGRGSLEFTITNNSQTETFSGITFSDDLDAMLPGAVAVDLPLEGGFLVDANFDGGGSSILGRTWDYLDELQNENGRNDDYPVDASGNDWNGSAFDPSTSAIGPWKTGNAPFQAGVVDAFPPGTPAVLGGIDAAANGQNLVTTYLFRQQFNLDADQVNFGDWLINYVFDDGAIIYLNGTEIFRSPGIPLGQATTTLSELGNETGETSSSINLSGVLVEGQNTIAVELHQTTVDSSDVGFSLELLAASESPTTGFSYSDDTFEGTNDAGTSNGTLEQIGGFSGGGITVIAGGKNFITGFLNPASSGGWSRTFRLDRAGSIPVTLRYRLLFDGSYDDGDFGQALFELNGVRYGNGPNNSLAEFNGGGGGDQDSGWRVFNTDIFLSAGEHTIILGAFNNSSNAASEVMQVFFDDIRIGSPERPAAVCGPNSQIMGSDVLSFNGGQLAPGQSCSFRVGVEIPISAPLGSYLNKTSLISTEVGQRTLVGFPATDTLNVVAAPPVFSSGFAPTNVPLNGTSTLIFTIDNRASRLEAAGVNFSSSLPAGMIIADIPSPSSSCGGLVSAEAGSGTISYSGGLVPAGEICSVTVDVTADTLGNLVITSDNLTTSLGSSGTTTATLTVSSPPLFSMAFGPELISTGQVSIMAFTIDNRGSQLAATDIALNHQLPGGLVLATPANPATTCLGGNLIAISGSDTISYIGGTVPAGEVCTVTVRVTSQEVGNFSNTSGELTSSLGNSGTANETLDVQAVVSIALDVTGSTETVIAGSGSENLTYVITATNSGPSTATGITITQAQILPSGTAVGNTTVTLGSFEQSTWTIPVLRSGESATLSISYTVEGTALGGIGTISGSATLTSVDQIELNNSDNSDSDLTSVINVFDIALAKMESIEPVVAASGAGNLIYTVTATNRGPSNATNIGIRESLDLPEGVTVQSIVPSAGSFALDNDSNGLWTLNLSLGETATLTVTLTVDTGAPNNGTVSSTSSLELASGTDSDNSNNSVTETTNIVAGVDLVVTQIGLDGPVVAGSGVGNLTYTIEVTNLGPLEATGLELMEMLTFADGIVVNSVTPSTGSFLDQIWSVGELAVGTSETLEVTLTVGPSAALSSPGVTSTASVSSVDQTQINSGNESASASNDIFREVDLAVSATNSRDPVLSGFNLPKNLFHTITVLNNGPSDASGVTLNLTEVLPDGASVESINPASGASFEDSVWTVGDIAVGSSSSIIYYFNVPETVTGGLDLLSNEASIASVNELLLNPTDDSRVISTDVVSPSSADLAAGAISLDLQTALFKQVITITNNNPGALPAFRILVSGMPEGVTIHNAQGEFGGNSYLLYNQMLESGESIDLVAEYYQLDASGGFEPVFKIELLDPVENQNTGEGVDTGPPKFLPNGDLLIEFAAQIGGVYTVQYSKNGDSWTNVVPDVISGGTRMQWIDNGPPKTSSHPAGENLRLYRVIQKDVDQ